MVAENELAYSTLWYLGSSGRGGEKGSGAEERGDGEEGEERSGGEGRMGGEEGRMEVGMGGLSETPIFFLIHIIKEYSFLSRRFHSKLHTYQEIK